MSTALDTELPTSEVASLLDVTSGTIQDWKKKGYIKPAGSHRPEGRKGHPEDTYRLADVADAVFSEPKLVKYQARLGLELDIPTPVEPDGAAPKKATKPKKKVSAPKAKTVNLGAVDEMVSALTKTGPTGPVTVTTGDVRLTLCFRGDGTLAEVSVIALDGATLAR